jgi:segregation and condensation protein A
MTEEHNHPIGPGQEEMPFALVRGEPLTTPPEDLFIPPDALEVILEAFEGPLDLLLYLIKRQNLDVLDIPVAEITAQYMSYIGLMEELRLELAAEYLVMAAMLAEIKSRMLLPRPVEEGDEDDPRAELVRRLQEYERFKKAAEDIDELPRVERDIQLVVVEAPKVEREQKQPDVELKELLFAFADVLKRADMFSSHAIQREPLSMRERMTKVLDILQGREMVEFDELFTLEEGRRGVVVTFTAILELMKAHLVDIAQSEPFAPIYIRPAGQAEEAKP